MGRGSWGMLSECERRLLLVACHTRLVPTYRLPGKGFTDGRLNFQ